MRADFKSWMEAQYKPNTVAKLYKPNTVAKQLFCLSRIEKEYGDLEGKFAADKFESLIASLAYSKEDQRQKKDDPSKFKLKGNLYTSLNSYRYALGIYRRFLEYTGSQVVPTEASKFQSGEPTLVRGIAPVVPAVDSADFELAGFEGEVKQQFIHHRRREGALRKEKIRQALDENGGVLICQVSHCSFDFKTRYGALGEGYAHVHHLLPLKDAPKEGRKTKLSDLTIVCPNCHAMIHRGGKCRPLESLIWLAEKL